MNSENQYSYTYSGKDKAEIKKIRDKYIAKEEDKVEELRRLDEGVNKKATVISFIAGIGGCLILGIGMSCVMVWGSSLFALGVIIGLVGIVGMSTAYPLFAHIIKKERERIAPEILRLSDELLKL